MASYTRHVTFLLFTSQQHHEKGLARIVRVMILSHVISIFPVGLTLFHEWIYTSEYGV